MDAKKIFLTAFVFLFFSISVNAATPGNNYLVLWGVKTYPDVIYSGDNFTFSFQIYNVWDHDADDVYVQIQGAYPLMQLSPAKVKHIDTIESSYKLSSERIYFDLHVDENAIAGTYPLTVTTTYRTRELVSGMGGLTSKDTTYTESSSIYIIVKGKPKIGISSSVKPEKIQPGTISSLTLKISNDGTDTAKDIKVNIEDTLEFRSLGTSRNIYVGDIEPKSSSTITVQMEADKQADAGVTKVPLTIEYSDKNNNTYTNSFKIPVIISVDSPVIDLSVLNSQPSKIRPGDTATITLKVWNKGEGVAKNVRVQALDKYPFTVAWANRDLIIGDIQSKAFSTANIQVEVKKNIVTPNWNLPIVLSYDNMNEREHFNSTENLEVRLEDVADFIVERLQSQSVKPDDKWVPIIFQIKNIGTATAREIKVTLNTQYPITPSGKQEYVNVLNAGDAVNVTFHVDVDSQAVSQNYPVDIYLQWKEESDTQYTTSKSSSIRVESAGSKLWLYVLVVLVIAAVFIAMRRKSSSANKKKKQEKENNG